MNKAEWWVEEARTLLRQFVSSPRPEQLTLLREHARASELADILRYLGCGDECSSCSWGELGGFQLRETCSLVYFLDSLRGDASDRAHLHSLRPGAENLLSVLDRADAPRPA